MANSSPQRPFLTTHRVLSVSPSPSSSLWLPLVCSMLNRRYLEEILSMPAFSVAQLCPALCDNMDCSLADSSLHGIFLARMLEWVAVPFSRRPSQSRNWTASPLSPALQAGCLPLHCWGSPPCPWWAFNKWLCDKWKTSGQTRSNILLIFTGRFLLMNAKNVEYRSVV